MNHESVPDPLNTPEHFFAAARALADELEPLLQRVSAVTTIRSAHRCVYFAARAALLLRGINLNRYYNELEVKDAFIKEYVDPGVLPERCAPLIEELHRLFVASEHGELKELTAQRVAETAVDNAMEFLAMTATLMPHTSSEPPQEEEDQLKGAYERGDAMKRDLLQECGALSLAEVAKLLDVSPEVVSSLRQSGKIIAVPHEGNFVYPAVQFAGTAPVEGLSELLEEIGSASWSALEFLVTEDSDQLEGRSPLQMLKSGSAGERDVVFRMARILAGDGFG